MRISDWSSDVCSSDLLLLDGARRPDAEDVRQGAPEVPHALHRHHHRRRARRGAGRAAARRLPGRHRVDGYAAGLRRGQHRRADPALHAPEPAASVPGAAGDRDLPRSEEHTSDLQSLMRISYAVFCLNKKKLKTNKTGTLFTIVIKRIN